VSAFTSPSSSSVSLTLARRAVAGSESRRPAAGFERMSPCSKASARKQRTGATASLTVFADTPREATWAAYRFTSCAVMAVRRVRPKNGIASTLEGRLDAVESV
jgi:hypothetical protein